MGVDPDIAALGRGRVFVRMIGRNVIDIRFRPLLGAQDRYRIGGDHPRYLARGIIEIAEYSGAPDAGVDAGRLQSLFHPVLTEIAFIRGPGDVIDEPGVVGTGLEAIFAADANIGIDNDDPVLLALPSGPGGTNVDASRFGTMIAQPR